jgi:hypothetical protein
MKPPVHSLSIVALLFLISSFLAIGQGVVSFDQRLLGGSGGGQDQVQGWEFIPRVNVTVLQLGLFDGRQTGGFVESHAVAIWNTNAELIVSSLMPVGDVLPLNGNFRFVGIVPTVLNAGETYVIGAFMPSPASDYSFLFLASQAEFYGFHLDPRIEMVAYRAGPSPGGIAFPQGREFGYIGAFGPNFVIAVPEPSVYALGLVGFFAIAGMRQFAPRVMSKGGGKPDNARGGGKDAGKLDEALAKAKMILEA